MSGGYQTDATKPGSNMCPEALDGGALLSASCLLHGGYSFIHFMGDSVMKELAWSFARAASSSDQPDQRCQPGELSHPRFKNAILEDAASWTCQLNDSIASSGTLCPAAAQVEVQKEDFLAHCCKPGHFSVLMTPMVFFSEAAATSHFLWNSTIGVLNEVEERCGQCRGLLVANAGLHIPLEGPRSKSTDTPAPWSYPWGTPSGYRDLFTHVNTHANTRAVLASTPIPDVSIMARHPAKVDFGNFAQLGVLSSWPLLERQVALDMGALYLPWAEVTQRFPGLQCDGLHHGHRENSRGCRGYTVVTDVVTQLLLDRTCNHAL